MTPSNLEPDRPLRILFMGTPAFALPTLARLIDGEDELIGVVTRIDKPKGRGKRLTEPPVKALAREHGIPVLQPTKLKVAEFQDRLRSMNLDFIVVVAYGKILPKEVLLIPKRGCVNVHASLLPRYRGAAPINWAIARGETVTGITTMRMDEGMDTGDILLTRDVAIGDETTAGELHDTLTEVGAELLMDTIRGLKAGRITPRPQDHDRATYAPMLKKEHGEIDWARPAREIRNHIRGMTPWPGTYTFHGDALLKVWQASVVPKDDRQGDPGEVIALGEDGIHVATGEGRLRITEVQREGRKRMQAGEFLRGHPVELHDVLGR